MDVDVRYGFADRTGHAHVVVAVKVRVDSALETDLGGPHAGAIGCPVGDLRNLQAVRSAPQVKRHRPLREATESTLVGADVRVVDVPVRHEGDRIAVDPAAQVVGYLGHCSHLATPRRKQGYQLIVSRLLAVHDTVEYLCDRPTPER